MSVSGFSWTHLTVAIGYPCCDQWDVIFERNAGVDPVTGEVYSGPSFFRAGMRPAHIDITPFVAGRKGVNIHFRYRAIDDGDWCLAKIAVSGNGLKAANLVSAEDVAPDQGHKVRLTWDASLNDGFLQGVPIVAYGVWGTLSAAEMGDNVVKVKDLREMISAVSDNKVEAGTQFLNATDSQGWMFLGHVLPLGDNEMVYHFDATVPMNDVNYDFMVSAHTGSGLVANSNVVTGMAIDNLPPAAPGDFAMVEENSKVKLSWSEPGNEEPAFYSVYRSNTSGVYGDPRHNQRPGG
jgi:hypothetical protein